MGEEGGRFQEDDQHPGHYFILLCACLLLHEQKEASKTEYTELVSMVFIVTFTEYYLLFRGRHCFRDLETKKYITSGA